MIPARRATARTSPFGIAPAAIRASVSGRITTSPRATASRRVTAFAETSTMRARPWRARGQIRRAITRLIARWATAPPPPAFTQHAPGASTACEGRMSRMHKPTIGLSDPQRAGVIEILNTLLADEDVLYTKTRNFHWNVTGPHFNDL